MSEAKHKFEILEIPFAAAVGTVVTLETAVTLGTNGTLVYCGLSLSSTAKLAADMFVQASLIYQPSKRILVIVDGYANGASGDAAGVSPNWNGNLPIDTNTQIRLEHLNASGETQRLTIILVIKK